MVMFLNNLKKTITILILIVSMLFLTACDPNAGKRPYDYPDTKWICEDPYVYIEVDGHGDMYSYYICDDQEQPLDILFSSGSGVTGMLPNTVLVSDETILFEGYAHFGRTSFSIELFEDHIWGGQYRKLKFKRIDTT